MSGCGGGPGPTPDEIGRIIESSTLAASLTDGGAVPSRGAGCTPEAEGCPCTIEGATVSCPGPEVHTGNYTSCEPGERTCNGGAWGACVSMTIVQNADSITQDYASPCSDAAIVRWGAVSLDGLTPGDSFIDVRVQTAGSEAGLESAPFADVGRFEGPKNSSWTSADVQGELAAIGESSARWLRITLTLAESSKGGETPTVAGWQVASVCVATPQ